MLNLNYHLKIQYLRCFISSVLLVCLCSSLLLCFPFHPRNAFSTYSQIDIWYQTNKCHKRMTCAHKDNIMCKRNTGIVCRTEWIVEWGVDETEYLDTGVICAVVICRDIQRNGINGTLNSSHVIPENNSVYIWLYCREPSQRAIEDFSPLHKHNMAEGLTWKVKPYHICCDSMSTHICSIVIMGDIWIYDR